MSSPAFVYRAFTLHSDMQWREVCAIVKQWGPYYKNLGRPLRLILTTEEKRRSLEQNALFHGPVLSQCAMHARWNGRTYPPEFWKEYLRRRFLLKDEFTTPDGEVINTYWSTSDLSVKQFSDFLEKTFAEMTSTFGVEFDDVG